MTTSTVGQEIDREYKLKSVYLYKFATYITWPEDAFRDSNSPFVIGILGTDRVGADLNKIAKIKRIESRSIEIRHYQGVEEIGQCHILFISKDVAAKKQQQAIKLLLGSHVLIVGEIPEFSKFGGIINFAVQDNRIHIMISQSAYERAQLEVSAQLLRITAVLK